MISDEFLISGEAKYLSDREIEKQKPGNRELKYKTNYIFDSRKFYQARPNQSKNKI